jgi:type II secretory pathway component GspD/PulD (secretin)
MKKNKKQIYNLLFITILFITLLIFFVFNSYSFSQVKNDSKVPNDSKITLNLKDVSLKELIYFITSKMDGNFILDIDNDFKVSINLSDYDVEQALNYILNVYNLEKVKLNDRTFVITNSDKAVKYKPKTEVILKLFYVPADYVKKIIYSKDNYVNIYSDSFSNSIILMGIEEKIPYYIRLIKLLDRKDSELITKTFKLSNAKAKDIVDLLKNSLYTFEDAFIASQVKIIPDERTNSLVITAPKFAFSNIEAVINDVIDKKLPQVLISVEVLEINRDKAKALGISYNETTGSVFTVLTEAIPNVSGTGGGGGTSGGVGTGVGGTGGVGTGQTFVETGRVNFPVRTSMNLAVTISFLQKEGASKVLANPKVLTSDGKKAAILIGDKVPYIQNLQTAVAAGSTTSNFNVQFEDVGTKLEFQPFVTKDGYINLIVHPQVSTLKQMLPGPGGSQIPLIGTREVQTEVVVKSGSIIVIGGLINDEERRSFIKVPFLGDIPLIGKLFQYKSNQKVNSEIIFVIKPEIINLPDDTVINGSK